MGHLPMYGKVWLHPQGIANILSLARLKEKYRINFSSNNGNKFLYIIKMGQKGTSNSQKEDCITLHFSDDDIEK